MNFRRVVLVIFDSVGIGEMPDADQYGDSGSDTLGNMARQRPMRLPNLCRLGLANIRPIPNLDSDPAPLGAFGKCALASPGKDTTTGHWEIAGIHLERPLPLYPKGFPPEVIGEFERRTGRKALGNYPASGTEIIKALGEEHMRTGNPIVYTSADSVFQIAVHEGVTPLPELYRMCEIAREVLHGPHEVGRVIARPFVGQPGSFMRDHAARHDYAVPPPQGMLLDRLAQSGVFVYAVGKIFDIYLGRGIRGHVKAANNADGMAKTLEALATVPDGFIFTNLVDFDALYGHRNDVEGYASALEAADAWLPDLMGRLKEDDLMIITADHGNDPTTPSTDHSREYVPLLAYGVKTKRGANLGTRATLSDVGQTVAHNFGVHIEKGTSFLSEII
jgi:phosphopentomutase